MAIGVVVVQHGCASLAKCLEMFSWRGIGIAVAVIDRILIFHLAICLVVLLDEGISVTIQ